MRRVCLLALCMLWLSQTGAGISCATTEVESESRCSWTVAFYTNGENTHCLPETHLMHSKRLHRDQKINSFAQHASLNSNKCHHYFIFIPPLISVTDLFGFQIRLFVYAFVFNGNCNFHWLWPSGSQRALQCANYSINLNVTHEYVPFVGFE